MDYTQLSEADVAEVAARARKRDPDAEVIASLEREHVDLTHLPESANPLEQERRAIRIKEIEEHLERYRGEA